RGDERSGAPLTRGLRSLSPQPRPTVPQTMARRGLVAAIVFFVTVLISVTLALDTFPEAWNLELRRLIDEFERWVIGNRATHWLFVLGFTPFSAFIDGLLRLCEQFLLRLPWS